MKQTRLVLETGPGSMLVIHSLCLMMRHFDKIASGVDQALTLSQGELIIWRLTYNWMPDDDDEAEMVPQYQPILFGTVAVVNKHNWGVASCPHVLTIDCGAGCLLEDRRFNCVESEDKKIIQRIVADLQGEVTAEYTARETAKSATVKPKVHK